MTIPPDLPAAVEHVANAIYDVLIPALITWIFGTCAGNGTTGATAGTSDAATQVGHRAAHHVDPGTRHSELRGADRLPAQCSPPSESRLFFQ